jgi:hypothetical protein
MRPRRKPSGHATWNKHSTAYANSSYLYQERVIACLRKRQREGKSVKCADVQREYPSLVNAAHRHFGSWREAMRSAELEAIQ